MFEWIKKIFSINNKDYNDWSPLPKRQGDALVKSDFLYSIHLLFKYKWLCHLSAQLDETIYFLLRTPERKRLLKKLLKQFKFVSYNEDDEYIRKIKEHIESVWCCNASNTIIMATKRQTDREPDGSSTLVYHLQAEMTSWNSDAFFNAYIPKCDIVKNLKHNIILCDDFIGSGWTINNRVRDLKVRYPNANVYVVAIAGMHQSKTNYLDKLDVPYFAACWLDAGLKEGSTDYKTMLEIESLLHPQYNTYSLEECSMGWGKSMALYKNAKYRIPNSCFPIFWWGKLKNGREFNSLFRRT